MVIYALKEMNNVMLVFWERKIMMHAAIKIVNYDGIKEQFAGKLFLFDWSLFYGLLIVAY